MKITKKTYVDSETGEIIEAEVVEKRAKGKQFWKLYLSDFLNVLGLIDSKQLDVLVYILDNTEASSNLFVGTYTTIGKEVNVSRQTIATIMKKLQKHNFIKKVTNGLWRINADYLYKGDEKKKQILLKYFKD